MLRKFDDDKNDGGGGGGRWQIFMNKFNDEILGDDTVSSSTYFAGEKKEKTVVE